jgi:hypothetical protein
VIFRCDSSGDLYPLAPSPPEALAATAPSVDLWHQRLGHPGCHVLNRSPSSGLASSSPPLHSRIGLAKPISSASTPGCHFLLLFQCLMFLSN